MPNIRTRKNKSGEVISYEIRVHKGYDINGKQLKPYVMTYKPAPGMTAKQIEKELNRQAVQFEEECKQGITGSGTKISLAEFCVQYLDIKKDSFSPATLDFYKNIIDRFIIPSMGHLKVQSIKPAHVQAFIKQLSSVTRSERNGHQNENGKKLSASTIRRYLTVLQSILKQAVKLDIIPLNPANADKLTLPKAVTPKIEIFNKQEAAEMLSFLEKEELQFQVLIQLAIMTGCRRGELVALKFSDIDFNRNKITVERAAIKQKGKKVAFKPPKDYEVRTITINPYCIDLIKLLQAEKREQATRIGSQWIEGNWLFTQWNGEPMNPQTPTKHFSKFLEKNGLKHRKFHSLRHTSATLLLYGGVNIKQVQERLGHGDIENIYTILQKLMNRQRTFCRIC